MQTVLAHAQYGCTPGFWKQDQHFEFWCDLYGPDDLVCAMFEVPCDLDLNGDGEDDTLLDALQYQGGPDYEGAAQILLRAGVAAVLNACYDSQNDADWGWVDLGPYWDMGGIIEKVNHKLDWGDREFMILLCEDLDDFNNAPGECPLPPE